MLPLGSEAAVVVMIRDGYPLAWVVTVATFGNYLGACTTYCVGRGAARALRGDSSQADGTRAARLVARYGAPTLAFTWVPLVGDALVIAAGAAKIPFALFSLWTAGGKLLRYVAVAWGAATW